MLKFGRLHWVPLVLLSTVDCHLIFPFETESTRDSHLVSDGAPDHKSAGLWFGRHPYRKAITIFGDQVPATQQGFPLLVALSQDEDLQLHATPEGTDIAFYGDDGTALAHEIEDYEGAHGRLVAWIRLPILKGGVDTRIYLAFGSPGSSKIDRAQVWTEYRAVWHLAGANGGAQDSSGYNSIGAVEGAGVAVGKIAGAFSFDGKQGRVVVGDPSDGHLDFSRSQSFSYSAWIRPTEPTGDYMTVLYKGAANSAQRGYLMETTHDGKYGTGCIHDGDDTRLQTCIGGGILTNGVWAQFVVVVDRQGDELVIYWNGVPVDQKEISGLDPDRPPGNSVGLMIGDNDYGFPFWGLIDEVRVVGRALPADWIKTEHRNQASPSTFYKVGPLEIASP